MCRRPSHPSRSVLVAVTALSHLLKERSVRSLFLRSGGVQLLGPLLKSPGGCLLDSLSLRDMYAAGHRWLVDFRTGCQAQAKSLCLWVALF